VSSDNPVHWSVDDVVRRISEADPTLVPYAGHFRKHVSQQNRISLIICRLEDILILFYLCCYCVCISQLSRSSTSS